VKDKDREAWDVAVKAVWEFVRQETSAKPETESPTACSTCGDARFVCDKIDRGGLFHGLGRGCAQVNCPFNRRPCPYCTTTDKRDDTETVKAHAAAGVPLPPREAEDTVTIEELVAELERSLTPVVAHTREAKMSAVLADWQAQEKVVRAVRIGRSHTKKEIEALYDLDELRAKGGGK